MESVEYNNFSFKLSFLRETEFEYVSLKITSAHVHPRRIFKLDSLENETSYKKKKTILFYIFYLFLRIE